MPPIAFRLGPVDVYTYPLVLIAAVLAAWLAVRTLAPRLQVPRRGTADLVLASTVGGLVGARVWHVATFPQLYVDRWRVFELQNGGLVFYGAVLGGGLAAVALARYERLSLAAVADLAAFALPVGAAIGRWGCLAAGCCGGPGLHLGAFTVQPQVVDSLAELLLLGVLLALSRVLPLGRGLLFFAWLALYASMRFGIEYLRADIHVAFGLTQAQLVSVPLVLAGLAGMSATMRRGGAG